MSTGITEKINKHPGVWIGSISGGVVVALLFVVLQLRSSRTTVNLPDRAFFTTDDGVSLFDDSISRIPPFEHGGAEAVRAYVFTCDGGQHRWTSYLGKYKSDAVRQVTDGLTTPASAYLVKQPAAGAWVPQTDPAAAQIMRPKPPDGMGTGEPSEMRPQG